MKKLLFLLPLLPILAFGSGPTNGPIKIQIEWYPDPAQMAGLSTNDYMTNIDSFVLYSTTNIAAPVWSPVTNLPPAVGWSTNLVTAPLNSTFFTATTKTKKGSESPFSPNDIWALANPARSFLILKGP